MEQRYRVEPDWKGLLHYLYGRGFTASFYIDDKWFTPTDSATAVNILSAPDIKRALLHVNKPYGTTGFLTACEVFIIPSKQGRDSIGTSFSMPNERNIAHEYLTNDQRGQL